eukprot:gnl/Spiro4/27983_TR13859_c0_g1_i1.p1 gnl/Spiro4/27983_TR13859_c0_g1~~gnl/Spiro4/27983_TR13859_c0_g1_i1.p1  ORF type:complete len:195 (+),score=29.32 gnl/Spiro4/27983_TR13859_c0_g1_i1:79-663(+)
MAEQQPHTDPLLASDPPAASMLASCQRVFQQLLDRTVPYIILRWLFAALLLLVYIFGVVLNDGFYIITYGLGLFLLHLLMEFLSPQDDPDLDGPGLPMQRDAGEYRPFNRVLPENKFWKKTCGALLLCLFLTRFEGLNVPAYWPLLLFYFSILCIANFRQRIYHMYKHGYLPFSFGKAQYKPKETIAGSSSVST